MDQWIWGQRVLDFAAEDQQEGSSTVAHMERMQLRVFGDATDVLKMPLFQKSAELEVDNFIYDIYI